MYDTEEIRDLPHPDGFRSYGTAHLEALNRLYTRGANGRTPHGARHQQIIVELVRRRLTDE